MSAAAIQNYSARRAMLARLAPKLSEAKQAEKQIREMQESAGQSRDGFELMRKLKHVPNFFPTPRALVDRMILDAAIEHGHEVLEPSAGKGDIINGIRRAMADGRAGRCAIVAVEIVFELAERLRAVDCLGSERVICADFLERNPEPIFDRVLMNPPFERGIDEDHVLHAHKFLKPKGRLVAIVCSTTGRKLESWVADCGGTVEPLEPGAFSKSERPTNVNTSIIVI